MRPPTTQPSRQSVSGLSLIPHAISIKHHLLPVEKSVAGCFLAPAPLERHLLSMLPGLSRVLTSHCWRNSLLLPRTCQVCPNATPGHSTLVREAKGGKGEGGKGDAILFCRRQPASFLGLPRGRRVNSSRSFFAIRICQWLGIKRYASSRMGQRCIVSIITPSKSRKRFASPFVSPAEFRTRDGHFLRLAVMGD